MPLWRDRRCGVCGVVENTASKSNTCRPCVEAAKKSVAILEEKKSITEYGYTTSGEPTLNPHGKREYVLISPCCKKPFTSTFGNLLKGLRNSTDRGLAMPCGICGPKHRFTNALEKYVEKYGRDYNLEKFEDYRKKVRGITENNYKKHKAQINPNNLPRGLNHGYHLDHKMPIIKAFKEGWAPEKCAAVSNLQMLKWLENLSKGSAL